MNQDNSSSKENLHKENDIEKSDEVSPLETPSLSTKINSETAKIPFHELMRFFAQGKLIWIHPGEDMIAIAEKMAQDDSAFIQKKIDESRIIKVTDEQAKKWVKDDALLWACVVHPVILVQEIFESDGKNQASSSSLPN